MSQNQNISLEKLSGLLSSHSQLNKRVSIRPDGEQLMRGPQSLYHPEKWFHILKEQSASKWPLESKLKEKLQSSWVQLKPIPQVPRGVEPAQMHQFVQLKEILARRDSPKVRPSQQKEAGDESSATEAAAQLSKQENKQGLSTRS